MYLNIAWPGIMTCTSLWSGYMVYNTDFHSENVGYEINNFVFKRILYLDFVQIMLLMWFQVEHIQCNFMFS